MAATHHGYNVVKMPGSCGIITVACEEKDAVCSLERVYHAAVVEEPDDEGVVYPPESVRKNKKLLLRQGPQEGEVPDSCASGPAPTDGALSPLA